jgi:hypothetical protein
VGATAVLVGTGPEMPHMDGVEVARDLAEAVDIVLRTQGVQGG